LIADPDLPVKARMGRQDEIRKCLRCFACLAGNATKRQICCAVNPEIGQEQEMAIQRPPAVIKTVLIAGGGGERNGSGAHRVGAGDIRLSSVKKAEGWAVFCIASSLFPLNRICPIICRCRRV
jgi:hypothetical protein